MDSAKDTQGPGGGVNTLTQCIYIYPLRMSVGAGGQSLSNYGNTLHTDTSAHDQCHTNSPFGGASAETLYKQNAKTILPLSQLP